MEDIDKNSFHSIFYTKIFDRLTAPVNTQHDYNVPAAQQIQITS